MMRQRNVVLTVLVALFFWVLSLCVISQEAQRGPGEEPKRPERSGLTSETPLAEFAGKTYKVNDVKEMIKYHQPRAFRGIGPDMITSMPVGQLEQPLKDMFTNLALYEKAKKEGFKASERTQESIEQYGDRILTNMLYTKEIVEKVPEATEEEARAEYEKKIDEFKTDFSFSVKQIILYTYKEYTSMAGDTLEGIAEKVSGTRRAVENIRDAETKQERWVAPSERDKKPFRPLKEGEKLLVPMSPREEEMLSEKILEIRDKLKQGADFDNLAREYSEGPTPGVALPKITPAKEEKPPLPEIIDAVKKTPVGAYTEVVKTKHGYQILKVEEKTDESVRPFDELKGAIQRFLTQQKLRDAAEEYLKNLLHDPKYAKVHKEVLMDDKASSSAVLVEIGDMKYTLADFNRNHAKELEEAKTVEDKLELLSTDRMIIGAIVPQKARDMGLDKTEEFKEQVDARQAVAIGFDYLQDVVEKQMEVTDEGIKKFYDENKQRYTTPRKYKISQILRSIGDLREMSEEEKKAKIEELTKELSAVKAKIKTRADFAKYAKEISDDPGTKEAGGELKYEVTETYKRGFDGRLQEMKVGDVSEPFVYGAFVYLVRVDSIEEEFLSPFSEIKGRVEADLRRQKRNEISEEVGEKALADFGYKLLIKK